MTRRAAEPLLSLSGATLGHPGQRVIEGVDLSIHPGDFLLVTGSNGSGKSTLLRSLLGVLPLRAGLRRCSSGLHLAYMPQQHQLDALFPVSTAEVVAMGLWKGPRPPRALDQEQRQAVATALQTVGLAPRAGLLFAQLSGGQKQRALLARSLVGESQLVLLDEPTAGVDAEAEEVIVRILQRLHREGRSLVLVTHQDEELRGLATRWIRLEYRQMTEQAL